MIFNRRSPSGDESQNQNRWFIAMLLMLLLLYWLFARHLERIDLSFTLAQWWQTTVPVLPLPGFVVFVIEMLHPRVLRHLLVAVVGWILAQGAAVHLVQTLYDLPDGNLATLYLGALRSPIGPIGKMMKVNRKTLAEDRESSVLLRVGGPGMVLIDDREVAVTELNGRFHRVLGPGPRQLGRLEYIYAVLDLRQQERVAKAVPLISKDGIEIQTDVTITYRISTGGEPPTRAKPYPYDEESVRLAAYAETVLESGRVSTWDSIPLGVTKSNLAQIIAKYQLDQLLYPHSSVTDPNLTIRNELERLVRSTLGNFGIELTGLHIGRMELPESVIEQYIEYWQAHWETQVQLKEVEGEARSLEEMEVARAEAEVTMIKAIVEGLQRVNHEGNMESIHEVVALRLIEALETVAEQSNEAYPLPSELMPQLDNIRQQLLVGRSNG